MAPGLLYYINEKKRDTSLINANLTIENNKTEAEDKKSIINPDDAITKMAVPLYQPNFCDCGLYLLHFATTFLSDPEKYMKITAVSVFLFENLHPWLTSICTVQKEA